MKKHSLIKLVGLTLAAALAFTGCDSGGSDPGVVLGGGGGTTVTGGGGTTTTAATGGTTGFGITGGSLTGSFGGSGGSGGTGIGTGSGGTSTGSTTGSTGGNNGFLGPTTIVDLETGLNNPTDFTSVSVGGVPRLALVDGFRQGANNGRLLVFNGSDFVQVGADAGTDPNVGPNLDSPFALLADGDTLYISVGFEQTNDGKIVRVDNFTQQGSTITATFTDITANTTPPINPTYMTLIGPINADGQGNRDYVYFTQYSPSGGGSNLVRRVSTDGVRSDIVMNNLNFPAGIDHDGFDIVVCDTAGGAGANGQVIVAPIQTTITAPLNAGDQGDVTQVQPATGEDPIVRPLDVAYDGNNGWFFTEGGALQAQTGPSALGPGAGAVRFIDRFAVGTATIVADNLTNAAGIDAIDPDDDGTASVLFSESIATNGRVLRRSVDTNQIDATISPTVTDTGINNPLFVAIADEDAPLLLSMINYIGGQNNGIFRSYGP